MEFNLRSGRKVEIIFWRAKNGEVRAFPENDLKLVEKEGTDQARKFLVNLLKGFRSREREISKQICFESL